MNPNGLYFVEDVGTSYRVDYNGGYRKQGTFVEYCKSIADVLQINEWGSVVPTDSVAKGVVQYIFPPVEKFHGICSVTFYMGMIVIRKVGTS